MPDDLVYEASSFLDRMLQDADDNKFFDEKYKKIVADVVASLDTIKAVKYQYMVDQIKDAVDKKRYDQFCPRARSLATLLDDLTTDDRARADPDMRREIQNYTNVVKCTYQDIQRLTADAPDRAQKIAAARDVVESMGLRLENYAALENKSAGVEKNAQSRRAELAALLGG